MDGDFWELGGVTDEALQSELLCLLNVGSRTDARVIAHLAAVEDRRLHLEAACSSMFDYSCARSSDVANAAPGASARHGADTIAGVDAIDEARVRRDQASADSLAARAGRGVVIEPISAARYRIQLNASAELKSKLDLAADLLSHSNPSLRRQ